MRLTPRPENGPAAVAVGLCAVLFAAALPADAGPKVDDVQTASNITRLTTDVLAHSQFAHHPFDDQLAATLLTRYLDALDGTHVIFLQSDVAEFGTARGNLAKATRDGDTTTMRAIFARYLERLKQRGDYASSLLAAGKFDFTGHDVFSFDRQKADRPANVEAAHELWRQEVRAEYLQLKLDGKKPSQIADTLGRRYARELTTMKSLRDDEVLEVYLDALTHVYDPHSDYLGHEEMESFSISMNLSLAGIGAALETEDGFCRIHELVPGGPAARSGQLKPGDRIVAVAQTGHEAIDVVNMPLTHIVDMIRGPKGTSVTLTLIPAGAADGAPRKVTTLVRDEIKLEDQEAKARIVDLPSSGGTPLRIGVVDLPSFYADMGERGGNRSATADVARLIAKLKTEKVRGIVLDIRRNGGGALDEAISMTGLFIKQGPVVQTRGPDGRIEVDADKDPSVAWDGPLVVLTSRFSASASEILAGALQDYGRAPIVGDSSTFGKGTVQNVLPLGSIMDRMGLGHAYDPGALKITISKFYRPSGASTQLKGVASDIVLPSTSDVSDVSEASLKDPLPWDVISAAPFDKLNRVQPYLTALREKSMRRIAGDKSFATLADDIAREKKVLGTKVVSLNEAERRKEVTESKARRTRHERERAGLIAAMPPTYEITLRNAGVSGLPPRLVPTVKPADPNAASSSADDPDRLSPDASPAEDILLTEGERILSDYVGQLDPASRR